MGGVRPKIRGGRKKGWGGEREETGRMVNARVRFLNVSEIADSG